MSNLEEQSNKLMELINSRRISNNEQDLLRRTFGDKVEIYMAFRNLFFGFDLDENEKALIRGNFNSPEIIGLIKKIYKPELQRDIPIGHNYDQWKTTDIASATPKTFKSVLKTKYEFFRLLDESFARLENPDLPGVDMAITKTSTLEFINARNSYLDSVDARLMKEIAPLAIMTELTAQQAMENAEKNSNQ